VKRNSTVRKPRVPPPLPPTASPAREPIYDYVATATFSADIQDGISFEKDTKLKVRAIVERSKIPSARPLCCGKCSVSRTPSLFPVVYAPL